MGIVRVAAAVVLIVGTGLVHGTWTNRWGASSQTAALAARFKSVPMVVGDWKATAVELGARERELAGAKACLSRIYTSPGRGATVSVLLVGGLPGDITTHTPDVCYPGAGYTMSDPGPYVHRAGADGPKAEFQTALAARAGADPSVLRIFWAWRGPEGWTAPAGARWAFASEPVLCKLYVIRETGGADVAPDRDPCNDFMAAFLPELDRAVFQGPGSPSGQ